MVQSHHIFFKIVDRNQNKITDALSPYVRKD